MPKRNMPLLGKQIVVTGHIPGYRNRAKALQALSDAGAYVSDNFEMISRDTDAVLISALQKRRLEEGGELSRKVNRALEYDVPLIGIDSEQDFRDVLAGKGFED